MTRTGLRVLLAGLALVLAGCTSISVPDGRTPSPGPTIARLEQRAALESCPASSASAGTVSNGLPAETLSCIGPGPAVHLAGLRGPAVVNLYGTWCGPCGKEAGFLSSAAAADKGTVTFLGVDIDDTITDALSYAAATKPPAHYPLVADPDDTVIHTYNPGPPATLFLNGSGQVVHVEHRAFTSTAAVQADVRRYLKVS